MGGPGQKSVDVNAITHTSLERVADSVESRLLPQLEALVEEKMDERPSSSDKLEAIVDSKLLQSTRFVTHQELELILMKKCDACLQPETPIGRALRAQDAIVEQINLWRGEKKSSGAWSSRVMAAALALLTILLPYGLRQVAAMHAAQVAKADALAAQIATALAQLQQHKGQP